MPEHNVITLFSTPTAQHGVSQIQGELFRRERNEFGSFAFLAIDKLSQEDFFGILTRNTVRTVVDTRQKPVFCRPRYIHSHVTKYMFAHKIAYIECAMLSMYDRNGITDTLQNINVFTSLFGAAISNGLTLLVYDDETKANGLVDSIKHVVRSVSSAVEILPISIR